MGSTSALLTEFPAIEVEIGEDEAEPTRRQLMAEPVRAHLVANARYHDTDFARLELLKLLGEHPDVRTTVAATFGDLKSMAKADFLITYTCDLRPTPEEEAALAAFVSSGGRWIALHATNAILDFGPDGVRCSREYDSFMDTMGSRFVAHPSIEPYEVRVSDPTHPLVAGIEPFLATDELYLCEYHGDIHPLLETSFTGTFKSGYIENEWPDEEPRLVAYTHPVGDGEVLYITLGHCCGTHDMRPLQNEAEVVRGSWEHPTFTELLRRSLHWAQGTL
ncbi:MAG: type 1 glutamine amidotransferase [Candidatus Poriferisodalaceae bacterium]